MVGLATSLQLGSIIGEDFEIQRRLGEGGMGVVFAATQLTTGYQRAVKVMHSPFVLDSKARARFEQEARISSRVPSDHVVQVVAAGVEEVTQTPWLAMELLHGHDLERHIESRGPMPLADVAFVVGQVGHALAAAHEVGIVHRDIKPENIFLSVSRVVGVPFIVKVLDFGIAKLCSSARSATVAVGTPAYMAPEQTHSNDDIGPAADVWALALVVFRMLTGDYFWRAASDDAALPYLWRELLVDPLATASQRATEAGQLDAIPPGFDAWFARCLERDPEERFQSAGAAVAALDGVFAAAGIITSTHASAQKSDVVAAITVEEAPKRPSVARDTHVATRPVKRTLRSDPDAVERFRVSFRESGERVVTVAAAGATLLETALGAGIRHYHACGGKARCSTCRVVLLEGKDNLGPRTDAELMIAERKRWPDSTRLACQAVVMGPCTVRRLVIDPSDASLVDIRRTTAVVDTRSLPATVLVLRLDGIDTVLGDGFPDDAVHVFERCAATIDELVTENDGRVVAFEGTTIVCAFAQGGDGLRRALRVGLRASSRVRLLNPYLLRHFGVQVGTAAGLADGILIEADAATPNREARVLIGGAVHDARRAAQLADADQVLVPVALADPVELSCAPRGPHFVQVLDFAKSDVVFLVQSTFDEVRKQADSFAAAFYLELFAIHPAAVSMFEHTDMVQQRKMLMDTLAIAVRGLDDFAKIEQSVRELGARHVDYGVRLADYQYVGRALLSTLTTFLGEAFTPEVELAWREIYSTLVRTMAGAA